MSVVFVILSWVLAPKTSPGNNRKHLKQAQEAFADEKNDRQNELQREPAMVASVGRLGKT